MFYQRDFREVLLEIFANRSDDCIDEIIQIVEESYSNLGYHEKLEEMILLLSESGNSSIPSNSQQFEQDEAAGYCTPDYNEMLENMFLNLCPIFLNAYYEENCRDKDIQFDEIVSELLEDYSAIRESRVDWIFGRLSEMLPDADPDYLQKHAERFANKSNDQNEMANFIEAALEGRDYPKKREYLKKQKILNELKVYSSNFNVDKYLDVIPDPVKYFNSPDYQSALTVGDVSEEDEKYAFDVLNICFPYLREKDIRKVFVQHKRNLVAISDFLGRIPRFMKKPRKLLLPHYQCKNEQLLQELAFIQHKQEIKTAIKMKNDMYRIARAEAEKYNLLQTCQCCFFEGLIPEECYFCKKNCTFCKDCVAKGAEHVIGKGELVFPCLSSCKSYFDLSTLQMVLEKKIFEPLFTRIQIEELKKANIDGLETCPFCDFSMILNEYDKVFKCLNIECMIESCRECRHKSHVPFRCNEIEYDEDVKLRTYIENKMTEALVRTCWKCNKSFMKESGCNKMTCICGAKMCYLCGATDISYCHYGFSSKCSLYTDNLNEYHARRVISSANLAKRELGVDNNPNLLKKDPTEGLESYFKITL